MAALKPAVSLVFQTQHGQIIKLQLIFHKLIHVPADIFQEFLRICRYRQQRL